MAQGGFGGILGGGGDGRYLPAAVFGEGAKNAPLTKHHPSPAMVVALIALVIAIAGSAYAAIQLPANSVGTKQIKNKAVTTAKLGDGAVTSGKLAVGSVGSKQIADKSIQATDLAFQLPLMPVLPDVHSGYRNGPVNVPGAATSIAKLGVPAPGAYSVVAKAWVENAALNNSQQVRCGLSAGVDSDTVQVMLGPKYGPGNSQALTFTVVHTSTSNGSLTIDLTCRPLQGGLVVFHDIKITAIGVGGELTNVPIS